MKWWVAWAMSMERPRVLYLALRTRRKGFWLQKFRDWKPGGKWCKP